MDCDDGNPCTVNGCVPGTGCVVEVVLLEGDCDDGDPCTQPGQCVDGGCVAWSIPCADGNPCTVDLCDSTQGGCVFVESEDESPCEDQSPCVTGGSCVAGICTGGEAVTCPQGECSVMACDPSTGNCEATDVLLDGEPCVSPQNCMMDGACASGVCVGLTPIVCDDGKTCTEDTCSPLTGACAYVPVVCDQTDDACDVAACGEAEGCVISQIPVCAEDGNKSKILLNTIFSCGDAGLAGWQLNTLKGTVGFAVDATPEQPGAWDDNCSLNINGPDGFSSKNGAPTHATATSPKIELSGLSEFDDVEIRVAFREWIDVDGGENTDLRWVGLVVSDGSLYEEKLLPKKGGAPGWIYRSLTFALSGAPSTLHLRFRFDSVDDQNNGGSGWFVDRLVVVSLATN